MNRTKNKNIVSSLILFSASILPIQLQAAEQNIIKENVTYECVDGYLGNKEDLTISLYKEKIENKLVTNKIQLEHMGSIVEFKLDKDKNYKAKSPFTYEIETKNNLNNFNFIEKDGTPILEECKLKKRKFKK